jgi:hypothetical protein
MLGALVKDLSFDQLHEFLRQHKEPIHGAYIISWYDVASMRPKSIPRMLGTDSEGVLYIGGSETGRLGIAARLKVRLNDFKSMDKFTGWFRALHAPRCLAGIPKSIVPGEEIRIEIHQKKGTENLEALLLAQYLKAFGELPPLNDNCPMTLTDEINDAVESAANAALPVK